MPFNAKSGRRGIPWSYCQRCGWQYPLDQLQEQNGLLVCTVKCLDDSLKSDPSIRVKQIADFLADMGPDAPDETAAKTEEANIVIDNF